MNPVALIYHIIPSAIIVMSFFFAMRCIFVHEMRLEAWRRPVKRRIYVDRATFKRVITTLGWLCLTVFLTATYYQIVAMMN